MHGVDLLLGRLAHPLMGHPLVGHQDRVHSVLAALGGREGKLLACGDFKWKLRKLRHLNLVGGILQFCVNSVKLIHRVSIPLISSVR